MEQVVNFLETVKAVEVVDIIVAICLIILFKVLSPSISYMIIKLFKFNAKNKKAIRESAFYIPLKVFITILGVYLAVLFLKKPLNIPDNVMDFMTKAFQIISVLSFAKALAESFTMKSTLVKRLRKNWKNDVDDSMLEFALKVVRGIIYVIALFVILAILQINLNGLVAGVGIGSIIVTLAAQDTAKNIFGGIVLFIDKPFKVGDWIKISDYEGSVEDMTFRTTRIRSSENSIINIPNSTIADSAVINWSKLEKRKYKINLTFSLETTSEQITQVSNRIREMLMNNPSVINNDTTVTFNNIANNGLTLLIDIYVTTTAYKEYLEVKNEINKNIMNIIHNSGLKLSSQATMVYMD